MTALIIKRQGETVSIDPAQLTEDELTEWIDCLQQQCDQITAQLDHAMAMVKTEGKFADAAWFTKAKHAKIIAQRHKQKLIQELANKRRAKRMDTNHTFDRRFVEIARQRLPADLFKALLDETTAQSAT